LNDARSDEAGFVVGGVGVVHLAIVCAQHDINMISVAQIVQYRLKHETLVKFSEPKSALLCGEAAKFYHAMSAAF